MNDFIPTHYHVTLEPNLADFRLTGSVVITGDLPAPRREVILNALELAIWRCHVTFDGTEENCSFFVDPSTEELRIHLLREYAGNLKISVDFEGKINDRMAVSNCCQCSFSKPMDRKNTALILPTGCEDESK